MPRRKKSSLSRHTAQVRKIRLARQRETPEEKSRRVFLRRMLRQHHRQNETAEERETRLTYRRSQTTYYRRRKQKRDCIEAGVALKSNGRKRKTLQSHEKDLQAVEVRLEPEVRIGACIEIEETRLVDEWKFPMPKISIVKSEKLIASVRSHMALYDPAHKDYSDLGVKAKLWNEVAVECGIKTGQEAKMMWKNLRDCYRICRNKLYYNPKTRVWKFYKHMDFLAPYIKDRKFRGRNALPMPLILENVDVDSGESAGFDGSIDVSENAGEFTTIQYWNDSEPALVATEIEPEVTKTLEAIAEPSREDATGQESPLDSDHESYEDVLPEALNNGTADNSLKMFFDAMYASTTQLPQSLQRSVKNKLFAAVLEAEEEAEKAKTSTPVRLRVKSELVS